MPFSIDKIAIVAAAIRELHLTMAGQGTAVKFALATAARGIDRTPCSLHDIILERSFVDRAALLGHTQTQTQGNASVPA